MVASTQNTVNKDTENILTRNTKKYKKKIQKYKKNTTIQKVPHTGNIWPFCMCVIQVY